jgi:hypothetical protein
MEQQIDETSLPERISAGTVLTSGDKSLEHEHIAEYADSNATFLDKIFTSLPSRFGFSPYASPSGIPHGSGSCSENTNRKNAT